MLKLQLLQILSPQALGHLHQASVAHQFHHLAVPKQAYSSSSRQDLHSYTDNLLLLAVC